MRCTGLHNSIQMTYVCAHAWMKKNWQRRLSQGCAGPSKYHLGRRFSATGTQSPPRRGGVAVLEYSFECLAGGGGGMLRPARPEPQPPTTTNITLCSWVPG